MVLTPASHARPARRPGWAGRPRGFTLIELLIGIVVLGILAAVAYPSFMESIRKGRRSEAFGSLGALQQAQERWRSNHAAYTTTLSDLNIGSTTASGYYTLSLGEPPSPATLNNGYVVTAQANAGTSQANDGECRKLSVLVDRGSVKYAGCASCSTFTYSASHACWSQ